MYEIGLAVEKVEGLQQVKDDPLDQIKRNSAIAQYFPSVG
jgi:hypothetical protein